MCGIAGLINFNGQSVSPIILKRMTDAIAHRGPDSEGHWIRGNVGIGHRRLSIIDLSPAGHQPMQSADNRYILSYNGEIYNYRELRLELETLGYRFKSQTDSEVVLSALAHWGTSALLKFNGMFALALWDQNEKVLVLARDRYGIKPIYYAHQNNIFLFASEQKSIIATPDFKRKLNSPALLEYMTFQNLFTDQTLLQDVHLLPAGSYGRISLENNALQTFSYWDYSFTEPEKKLASDQEYGEELDRLFFQAVNRQLVGDVELGSYLSGGIDSGSITAIASKSFPNLKTFTCGFDLSSASGIELGFDERVKAEAMSSEFRTEHYEMVLKAGDMERCLPRLAWHLEEPRVGQSYPNYYAAQLASKFVKIVLSGSGGDELFAGYPWRYYTAAKSENFEEFIDHYYLYWQRLIDNRYLQKMFKPISKDLKGVWTRDIFRDVFARHDIELSRPEDYINHSLYFEAKTFLHGLFVVEDKLSMAHSLESRVPFMDNDLVDFAMSCPISLKLNNLENSLRIDENTSGNKKSIYFEKTNDGKQILRDMMVSYVPEDITKAPKKGFSSPDASWFRGESSDFVRDIIMSKKSQIYDYVDFDVTSGLIEEHLSGKENRRLFIWSLLNLDAWMSQTF